MTPCWPARAPLPRNDLLTGPFPQNNRLKCAAAAKHVRCIGREVMPALYSPEFSALSIHHGDSRTGRGSMYTLYSMQRSGNSYKVRLALARLGIAYRLEEVDILKGDSHTPEF